MIDGFRINAMLFGMLSTIFSGIAWIAHHAVDRVHRDSSDDVRRIAAFFTGAAASCCVIAIGFWWFSW